MHYGWKSGLAIVNKTTLRVNSGTSLNRQRRWIFRTFGNLFVFSSFKTIFSHTVNFCRTLDKVAVRVRKCSDNSSKCASWYARVYAIPVGSLPDPWQSTSWYQRYRRRQRVRRVAGDGQSNYLRLTARQFTVQSNQCLPSRGSHFYNTYYINEYTRVVHTHTWQRWPRPSVDPRIIIISAWKQRWSHLK
jgi:hypothetical protein